LARWVQAERPKSFGALAAVLLVAASEFLVRL